MLQVGKTPKSSDTIEKLPAANQTPVPKMSSSASEHLVGSSSDSSDEEFYQPLQEALTAIQKDEHGLEQKKLYLQYNIKKVNGNDLIPWSAKVSGYLNARKKKIESLEHEVKLLEAERDGYDVLLDKSVGGLTGGNSR